MSKKEIRKDIFVLLRFGGLVILCLACGISLWRTWYIPWFDRLTPQYGEELSSVISEYLNMLDSRNPEADETEAEINCLEFTEGEEFALCVTGYTLPTMGASRFVSRFRVIEYNTDCATAFATIDVGGSGSNKVYLFKRESGEWKIAETSSGDNYGNGSKGRAFITYADPLLPFSCSTDK